MSQKGNIMLVLILAIAALALWAVMFLTPGLNQTSFKQRTPSEIKVEQISKQGTSDDPLEIEKDANSTDMSDLDSELDNIQQELQ